MPFRAIHLMLGLTVTAPSLVAAQDVTESGTFTVLHADDTVASEQFTRSATKLQGTLLIHNARRTSQRWTAVIAPDATLPLIEVTVQEGADSGERKARVAQRARVIFKEDSVSVDAIGGDRLQTRLFATDRGAVPYLNLSFALLEQAVRRTRATPEMNKLSFFNLGGGQTVSATLSPLGTDSLKLTIGNVDYHLRVDAEGRLLGATIPAQDVVAQRR